jgi:hypothetical protein
VTTQSQKTSNAAGSSVGTGARETSGRAAGQVGHWVPFVLVDVSAGYPHLVVANRKRNTRKVDLRALARATAGDSLPEAPASLPPPASVDIPLASVPHLVLTNDQLIALPLDPRRAFLLSLLDGTLTAGDVLDACGFERAEAIEMLASFVQSGIIVLRRRKPGRPQK